MLIFMKGGHGKCCALFVIKNTAPLHSYTEIGPTHFNHFTLNWGQIFDSENELLWVLMHLNLKTANNISSSCSEIAVIDMTYARRFDSAPVGVATPFPSTYRQVVLHSKYCLFRVFYF